MRRMIVSLMTVGLLIFASSGVAMAHGWNYPTHRAYYGNNWHHHGGCALNRTYGYGYRPYYPAVPVAPYGAYYPGANVGFANRNFSLFFGL